METNRIARFYSPETNVDKRIDHLCRMAHGQASKVAEKALDSGCTNQRPTGRRSAAAWDMVEEALWLNSISDNTAELARLGLTK